MLHQSGHASLLHVTVTRRTSRTMYIVRARMPWGSSSWTKSQYLRFPQHLNKRLQHFKHSLFYLLKHKVKFLFSRVVILDSTRLRHEVDCLIEERGEGQQFAIFCKIITLYSYFEILLSKKKCLNRTCYDIWYSFPILKHSHFLDYY